MKAKVLSEFARSLNVFFIYFGLFCPVSLIYGPLIDLQPAKDGLMICQGHLTVAKF
jgi:hypothetical protein